MSVRVRFAPSPTGHIHVGNVRTALFNYLFARNQNGKFILRIEDTDLERSTKESEDLIYEDLKWLGLEWDEGPLVGGDYGPYRQTERLDIYHKCADKLIETGYAYKCFCSKEELDADREKAQKEGRAYIYSGKCSHLSNEEIKKHEDAGEKPSIRFRAFKANVLVRDMIHGDINFPTNAFGDFIIVRPDGVPIYNYVVVVDDALMKITHVIRGDDHLSNTPKQALLYEALGYDTPIFAHIPMILGPDKTKLSKRHGNTSIEQFRTGGYLREAMVNYMALLSWSGEGERELYTIDELKQVFSIKDVSKSAAVFDFDKLNWMNGMYIRQKPIDELLDMATPFIVNSGLLTTSEIEKNKERLKGMLLSVRDSFITLADAAKYLEVYFKESDSFTDEANEVLSLPTTIPVLKAFIEKSAAYDYMSLEEYKALMKTIQTETGAKGKALYMAVRAGVTGSTKGPEMDSVATLLSTSELRTRIKNTLNKIGNS